MVALLPVLAFAIFAAFSALSSYRAADDARLRDTARALAAAVDAQLGAYISAIQTLSSSRQLDGDADAQAFAQRSRAVGDLFDGWVVLLGPPPTYPVLSISVQTDDAALPTELPPNNRRAIQPLLTQVFERGEAGISDLFLGSVVPRQILTAMVPVIRDGLPARALALSFEPTALRQLLARQDLPPGTFAAIADGQLRILAHSLDPEGRRIGTRAPDWVDAAVEGKQRTLVTRPGWNGADNVYAIERLRLAPGWTVAVAEPLTSQQASAWAALRWVFAGGAALCLGLTIVVWASRREALQDARREAEALRAGRADVERLHGGLPAVIFLRETTSEGPSRIVYRGGDLEAVMGWPAAEVAGRQDFDDLCHPEDMAPSQLGPQLQRAGHASHEWRMRQPDGSWRRMHTSARVLGQRPDGKTEIVGYTVDVTARHEAERKAEAAQRDLEQALRCAPVVVVRCRVWPDGHYERSYISPAIERVSGWPIERMRMPRQLSQLCAPEDRAGTPEYMRGLVRNGSASRILRLQHADGHWISVRIEMTVIDQHEDGSVEAVGYLINVTAEREAQARAFASARLASLGEMAAGLAHEIKQPLQAISLAAEIAKLAAEQGNPKLLHHRLDRIVDQAQRTADLIDRLRRFARGDEDGSPLQPVVLADVVHGSLELARSALRAVSIDVEVTLGEPPPVVRGQPILLEQVLSNLILNARDAVVGRPAGAPRWIRIAANPAAGDVVLLTVSDSGGGIKPEVMGRLFEPFVTTKGPDKGTGLGLSICHGLIKGMGGSIEAHNASEGAVFTITLPSAPAEDQHSRPRENAA